MADARRRRHVRADVDPIAKLRRVIKAGPRDVIEHLVVDVPPCDPDEEREVETAPRSEAANAMVLMLRHLDGAIAVDFTETNLAAIIELGGTVTLEPYGPARGQMDACYRPDPSNWKQVVSYYWDVPYVEPREVAEKNARHYPAEYAGWNEPPPPELTAEQAAAIAAEARAQAAEASMVALAERELAAEAAARAFPKVAA